MFSPSSPLQGATIVFDLDGTLVDTAPDLVAALNHVLTSEGRAPVDPERVQMLVGHGARALIERGFQETGAAIAADGITPLLDRFLGYYEAHIADGSKPFPGTVAALERLALAGATLAVCTNKYERFAHMLLETLDLKRHFAAIVGSDTLARPKPDPDTYHGTVRRAGGRSGHSAMIGDSPTDAATAKAAGVPFVAVSFGYTPVPPSALGADILIDHFDALDGALNEVLSRL